jgi:excisionase family DNA binding protein
MNLQRVLENNPAYSLAEVRAIARVGCTTLYKAIGTGELRAIKVGSRTLILERDLYRWLEGMPPIVPNEASPELPGVEPSGASSEISQGSGDTLAADDPTRTQELPKTYLAEHP